MNLNNQPVIKDNQATYHLEDYDLATYQDFIQIRSLPSYKVTGQDITFSASYLDKTLENNVKLPLELTPGLFDYQQVVVKVAFLKKRYAIFADAGLGKCHGVDTPVLMYNGSIRMVQDIVPGDELMGPDSKPRKVLSTNKGYGDIFEVTPVKGDSFVCNDVHVLSLRCTGTKENDNSGQYIKDKVINIPLDKYLAQGPMFKSYYKLWRTGVNFNYREVEYSPYMVGLYLGDGHKHCPAITTCDRNIEVSQYIRAWALDNRMSIREQASGASTTRFLTGNPSKAYRLRDLCYDRDMNKRIPIIYLRNDENTRLKLLAGLLDSDGYYFDGTFEIVSKYEGLARDILYLAKSLGFGATFKGVEKGIKSSGFRATYYKVSIYGHLDRIPTLTPRKQAPSRRQKKNPLNTGFGVEYIGKGDYYGFTLEGDGLYLLGDFTVTHNTLIMGELARQLHTDRDDKILFCVPLNVLRQFEEMCADFFPDFPEFIHLHKNKMILKEWMLYDDVPRIGFVNHETFIRFEEPLRNVGAFFLDESSILKGGQGGEGKIAKHIVACTKGIKYKIAASATPAPNDRTEYAMTGLFLEQVQSEKEFYSLFFTIKDDKYVLKRHATEAFYRYLSTFSIFIRNPAAYGFEDNLKNLRPWQELHEVVDMTDAQEEAIGQWSTKGKQRMLPSATVKPKGMTQRGKFSQISKGFYYQNTNGSSRKSVFVDSNKPRKIAEIVQSHLPEQVIIWTVFDEEGEIIKSELDSLGIESTHITGKVKPDDRVTLIEKFRHDEIKVVISKPRILGFGLNFQFCRIAIFSGLQDSYELYYQAVKRIHRYGQEKQVLIYHIYTRYEEVILANVMGKQKEARVDFDYQEKLYVQSLYEELKQFLELEDYRPMEQQKIMIEPVIADLYELYHGDTIEMMLSLSEKDLKKKGIDLGHRWLRPNSVDLSVFSPPFMGDVFTYSNDPGDMGNTRGVGATGGLDEFMMQFQFFLKGMLTVTKPGRLMAMHLEDVPLRKSLDGHIGLFDFVGQAIRNANEADWILLAKIPIIKNQQMTAIVKKVSSLSMSNMETDRLRINPCLNGYLCLFRKPGESKTKVADLARCNSCSWQGYAKDIPGWQPVRGYKNTQLLASSMVCPQCSSNDMAMFSEMDGNKWIMLAEGVWTDAPEFNPEDYDKIAKTAQAQRWHDLVYTALGVWPDINEPETLPNPFQTNDQEDADKHLCPLPIETVRRAIELYTLPGELVFDPFVGIGTTAVTAVKMGRKAIGGELKPEYFMQAVKNTDKAVMESQQTTMWEFIK